MSFLQVLVNTFIRASELGLVAIGLSMTYDILKFANFSHVSFVCIGAYLAYLFNVTVGLNILLAMALSACLTGLLGVATDTLIFKRLRGVGKVTLMVTSLGVSIVLRNIVRTIWGTDIRGYIIPLQKGIRFLRARITPIQIGIIGGGVLFMVLFHLLLTRTKLGKAMRAMSDNPNLAQASGIATENIIKWTWFIGTSFAAVGGVLIGLDTQLQPRMGFDIIIPAFCAAILGGLGNPYGAMLGALALGFAENFGLFFDFGKIINLGGVLNLVGPIKVPTGYKPAIGFIILVIILLVKPSGILGKKGR